MWRTISLEISKLGWKESLKEIVEMLSCPRSVARLGPGPLQSLPSHGWDQALNVYAVDRALKTARDVRSP